MVNSEIWRIPLFNIDDVPQTHLRLWNERYNQYRLVSSFFLLQGLIVGSRKDSLQHFKKPWAHEHEPVKDLVDAVKVLKTLFMFMSFVVSSVAWTVPYYTLLQL